MVEFLLFIQQALASGTHIVAKSLTYDVNPQVALFFRGMIASALFAVWMLIRKKKMKRLDRRDIPVMLILGLINLPINQFLFLTAISLTSPPNVALAYALTPAFVLVIALIFLKESASLLKIIGVILAIGGTVLVISENGIDFSTDSTLGDILVLIASFSWALYTVIGKNFTRKYGAIQATAMATITGWILYLPVFYILPVEIELADISAVNWLQLLYIGGITSVVAYALWYYALTKSEASKVAVFNNVQPVLTTVFSIIFLGHILSWQFIIGGTIVITGVIMTQRG